MQGRIDTVKDDFWTEHLPFFSAQFPTYYRELQQVHGRFHADIVLKPMYENLLSRDPKTDDLMPMVDTEENML